MVYFPNELWNIIKNFQFREYWLKKYSTVITNIPKAILSKYMMLKSYPLDEEHDLVKQYYKTSFFKDNYHGNGMIIEYRLWRVNQDI